MAGNLNKTKHRIASINSTKKITKAMELVSTVKLKKFKNVMLKNELYSNELKSLTCTLFSRLDDEENKYTKLNDAEKDLLIVVSSNLGLCAGYNNDIYHYVEQNFDKNEVVIIPIGMKGDSYFKKNGFALNEEFVLLNEKINYLDITRLGKTVLSYFENNLQMTEWGVTPLNEKENTKWQLQLSILQAWELMRKRQTKFLRKEEKKSKPKRLNIRSLKISLTKRKTALILLLKNLKR